MANALCSGLLALMILPAFHVGSLTKRWEDMARTANPERGVSLAVFGAVGIVFLLNRRSRD